ncbi:MULTISPECIES: DUF6286 domain-containing protein [unclassified Streptomyces]|uniref:DUF6286 domain-containing protein n=1 Tax=unclassified Streptomyces TaxID=2593676 RepID=UPI000938CAD0|nr:DUF6286 domain-containing protein [Streptomyces sp. TSRI0281]OKI45547.1 hypothetical protein A6A29_31180 [Streptomyces sp. TSRI0281]
MTEPHEPTGSTQRLPATGPRSDTDVREPDGSAGSSAAHDPAPAPEKGGGRAGRFWSARRIPAALLALVVLGGAGLLLYDIAAVRADHPAMQWRRSLADDLAERPLDNVWVLVGAGIAAALGLWLILLALTPGLRDLLPMRRDRAGVRAALDRTAAALVLRDRAVEVSGVQSVRVRMGRGKAAVRAVSHFRELDDVRTDLDAALGAGIKELGLARQPSLSVQVRRPTKKG